MRSPVGRYRQHHHPSENEPICRFEQYACRLDEQAASQQVLLTKYNGANWPNGAHFLSEVSKMLRADIFQPVVESCQIEASLAVTTQYRGVPLSYRGQISQDVLCGWLLQLLSFYYGIIKKNWKFEWEHLRPAKVHVDGNRLLLLAPNVFATPVSLRDSFKGFIDYLMAREEGETRNAVSGGYVKQLLVDVRSCDPSNIDSLTDLMQRLRHRDAVLAKSNSIPMTLFKNNRWYVRKDSVNSIRKEGLSENIKQLIRRGGSNGKCDLSEKADSQQQSPYRRVVLKRPNPLNVLLLNEKQHPSNIPKLNRLAFQRRKQTNFQSQKQIKAESPQKPSCSIQTDRRSLQNTPALRPDQPKSIEKKLTKSRQPKLRRESKVQRKLIIRNPFEKKQQLQRFVDLNESIIQRKLSSAWQDSQLASMVRDLDGCSPETRQI